MTETLKIDEDLKFESKKLPEYKIKVLYDTAKSSIFESHTVSIDSKKANQKATQKLEQKFKVLQDNMNTLSQMDMFKVMTGSENLKI